MTIPDARNKRTARRVRRPRKKRKRKQPFNFKLWAKSWYENFSTSLFFSPALAIVNAIVLAIALTYLDSYLSEQPGYAPPVVFTTTVDSARTVLSTIAGATISFAGTAFSVSLLVIQLGSSQYSPRIVHTLFKDPFSRRIVAFVVGTFTYCLVVMRSVDSQIAPDDSPVVPNISVAVAVALGILSVLFIVAYIDHSAHHMDISQLLERVTRDTITHIEATWQEEDIMEEPDTSNARVEKKKTSYKETTEETEGDAMNEDSDDDEASRNEENEDNPKKPKSKKGEESTAEGRDDCHVVRFQSSGWIQDIDVPSLLKLVPSNGYMKIHTLEGRYAIPGAAVCSVFPKPGSSDKDPNCAPIDIADSGENEDGAVEDLEDAVLDCVLIGQSRSLRKDATYGLRQLVDVVLRALSPGVNDPTTAQDGIFHVAAVVTEFLHRTPPAAILVAEEGGKLILNEQQDYDSIVRLGFDEARICASSSPTVAVYLLESLRLIRESLKAAERPRRAPEIERQAKLIVEGIQKFAHIDEDHSFIIKAKHDRFDADEESPKRGDGGWFGVS